MAKKQEENKQIEELIQKVLSLEDQLKRAVADYRNLEKRVCDDSVAALTRAKSQFICDILPALDHLNQAILGAPEHEKESGWFKGVEMAVKQLHQSLQNEGLQEIDVSGKFNPSLHEAVDVKSGEDDKILEVAQKGYTLNGKVVRPAKVIVGKGEVSTENQEVRDDDIIK